MAKVSIGEHSFDAVEVELWDVVYKTKPLTRSVAKKVGGYEKTIQKAEAEGDFDAIIASFGRLLDDRLEATNGSRKKPSTLIKEKWESDELSLPQLEQFTDSLQEAERPS